jgi:hypothetical protein
MSVRSTNNNLKVVPLLGRGGYTSMSNLFLNAKIVLLFLQYLIGSYKKALPMDATYPQANRTEAFILQGISHTTSIALFMI